MKKILIINLARMGDLLQSTPMIAGLKHKYPEAEISLLVQENSRQLCAGFPGVDRILSFDPNGYINQLFDQNRGIDSNYLYLKRFLKRTADDYDLIINLSHTLLSGRIAHLIGAPEFRGMKAIASGWSLVKHRWMEYFFYITAHRQYNTFNLVDMYNGTGEVKPGDRKLLFNAPPYINNLQEDIFAGTAGEYIGFQLGASTDIRRWPPEYFGRLAGLIRKKYGWNIVILGTNSERKYLEEMQEYYSGPVIDAMGKTTMPQLGALLKKCRFLVTNDTGTMHFAAAVGTSILAIFLGEARSSDTGPYTEKAVILEANIECAPCDYNTDCEHHDCHRYVNPENVMFAMENFEDLTAGPIQPFADNLKFTKIKLYRPVFEPDGYLITAPLIKRPLTFEELLRILYRRMWKYLLGDGSEYHRTEYDLYHLPPVEDRFSEKIDDFIRMMERIDSLGNKGLEIVTNIKEAARSEQRDENRLAFLSAVLTLLDNSLARFEWNHVESRPVTKSARLLMKNIDNNTPEAILAMTERIYRTLVEGTQFIVNEMVKYKKSLTGEISQSA